MTVENCIKLLEAYKKQAENPVSDSGMPLTGDNRKHAAEQSKKNVEMMKSHILSSKKFQGHDILKELQKPEEEEEKPKTKSKGKK